MSDFDWSLDLSRYDVMVDIDDVLMPTIDEIHERSRLAGLHDGSAGPEWTGWTAYGCPEQAYWNIWTQFANEGGYLNTAPIPGSVEALRRLFFGGARIHLVTARGFMAHADRIRSWTPDWVEEFAVPHTSLTFARRKDEAMETILRSYGDSPCKVAFDYAIDDSPKNVRALDVAGVEAYLLSHHHNRADDYRLRVSTVGEFADIIVADAARRSDR